MNMDDISKRGQAAMKQATEAVEKAGAKVVKGASDMINAEPTEIAEEAIHSAIDQALDILQMAGEKVRQKDLDAERVTLQVGVGVSNVAHLRITADVPSDRNKQPNTRSVDVDVT